MALEAPINLDQLAFWTQSALASSPLATPPVRQLGRRPIGGGPPVLASVSTTQIAPSRRGDASVTLLGVCSQGIGGEGGIRTHVTLSRKPHFECGAFDHSATSPGAVQEADNCRPRSRARYLAASPRRRKPPVRFLSKLFCGQRRRREIIRLQPNLAAAWRADFAAGLRPDRQSLLRSTAGKRGPDSGGEGGRPARMATRSAAAASSGSGRKASAAVRRAMKSS